MIVWSCSNVLCSVYSTIFLQISYYCGDLGDVSTFALYLVRFHLDCYKMFLFSFYTFQFFWQMASLSGVTFDNYIFERLNMILLLEIIPEPSGPEPPRRLGHSEYKKMLQKDIAAYWQSHFLYKIFL